MIVGTEITVMGGVAMDKLANAEGWAKPDNKGSTGSLDALVARMLESGASLEITVKTPDPMRDAIIVTGEKD